MADQPKRILRNPILDRFDFVPAGDNPEAHITLMKAKGGPAMADVIEKKEEQEVTEETVAKMSKADLVALVKAQILEKDADDATAALTQERDDLKKSVDDLTAKVAELEKAKPADPDDKEAIYKGLSDAQRAHFEKMEARAKETEAIAKAERDARVTSECVAFVKSHAAVSVLSETDDIEMLKFLKAHENGKYLNRFSQILKSKIEVAKAGGDKIFTETGHGNDPEPLNVIDKVNQLAKAEQEKDSDLDTHAAVAKVLNSNAVLYEEYRKAQQVSV